VAITVWTGAEYVLEALKLRASGRRARQQIQEGKK
jgi:CDP-diacylglycerol--glycerol-3-phosphate 3-phosphatidyltransferase/cardiolipin synthase